MMCIVIHVNNLLCFNDVLKSSFYTRERLQCFFNGGYSNTTEAGRHRGGDRIFNVMKTRDTELNVFNFSKTMEVELKKSAFGGNVAGKKLSPAHAVNIFRNMTDICGQ